MSSLTSEFSKEEIQHSACAQQSHVKFVLGKYEIITFLCTKYISVTMRITCYGYFNSSTQSSCDTVYIYIYNQQKNLCDLHVHTMAEYSNQVHRKLSCIYVLKHLNSTPFWFRVVQANFIVCFIMDGYLSVICRCLLLFLKLRKEVTCDVMIICFYKCACMYNANSVFV